MLAVVGASLGFPVAAVPETFDRVVASIDNLAITQAEVEAEYRFEMLLDGKVVQTAPDGQTLALVRDRLIEQKLLAEEAEERTEAVDPPARLDEVRQRFQSDEAFQSALRSLGLNEQQLATRMALQENTLRRIEQRFRPSAWPAGAEIEAYYRDVFVPELARQSQAAPPALSEVEDKIREILVERKIDDLLGTWLKEMKSTHRVKVHDF